jgi:hypothetical protein
VPNQWRPLTPSVAKAVILQPATTGGLTTEFNRADYPAQPANAIAANKTSFLMSWCR